MLLIFALWNTTSCDDDDHCVMLLKNHEAFLSLPHLSLFINLEKSFGSATFMVKHHVWKCKDV